MLGYVSEREFKLQFEDSFKQFFKPLCFHAMSFVKDADIAKDIVHDVFLTTWTQREKIDFTQPMSYSSSVLLFLLSFLLYSVLSHMNKPKYISLIYCPS